MYTKVTETAASAFNSNAMETRNHSKNRVSPKNDRSRRNNVGILIVLIVVMITASHASYAQYVQTLRPSNITATSAICGGKIIDPKVGQILQKGICYMEKGKKEEKSLNTTDSKVVFEGTSEHEFTGLKMTGLKKNTTYLVRAYIVGTDGSSYGNIHEFMTLEYDDNPIGKGIGEPTATTDPGVLIYGVRWATRNVDAPGTFAPTPESPGMLYKWNSNKAWPSTGLIENWDAGCSKSETWQAENDSCPKGWRLPSINDIGQLRAWSKCVKNEEFIGVHIKDGDNQIFIPYVQYRDGSDGALRWGYIRSNIGYDKYVIKLPTATTKRLLEIDIGKKSTQDDSWGMAIVGYQAPAYPCRCVKAQ